MKNYLILGVLLLTSCGDNPQSSTNDTVILIKRGELKKSEVVKFGVYCTVAWFKTIEHLILKRNGTINNPPFEYKWTLNELNADADKIWFDKNCKEET